MGRAAECVEVADIERPPLAGDGPLLTASAGAPADHHRLFYHQLQEELEELLAADRGGGAEVQTHIPADTV